MNSSNNTASPSSNNKEPWLAVILSAFFSGIGQLYTGNVFKGWIFIISEVLLYSFIVGLTFSSKGGKTLSTLLVFSLLLLLVAFLTLSSIFDAYYNAVNKNDFSFEAVRKSTEDPWKAFYFSMIVPGAGHFYIGKKFIGILIITGWLSIFSWQLTSESITRDIIKLIITTAIAYHVYIIAPIKRELSNKLIIIISILSIAVPLCIFYPLANVIGDYFSESRIISFNTM
jgi:signal peptidase I